MVLIMSLVGLGYKHVQIRAKLREYKVTQNGQNFDNPLFTGQHTSAERYGSIYQSGNWFEIQIELFGNDLLMYNHWKCSTYIVYFLYFFCIYSSSGARF